MNILFDELPAGLEVRLCIPEEGDTELIIPEGVTSIHDAALRSCTQIVRVSLPSTVRLHDGGVFSTMSSLEHICVSPVHPDLLTLDGVLCRKASPALISLMRYPAGRRDKYYELPEEVHAVGRYAFSNAVHLERVTLHENIFDVGEGAFSRCKRLRVADLRCKHLFYLREAAFRFCASLEIVLFSGFVEHVEAYAFDGCIALDHADLPEGLTDLGNAAFCRCPALKSVFLPASLTDVGRDVFYDCDSLEIIRCTKETAALIPFHHDVVRLLPSV